jgi:hypothetical protein
MFGYYNNYNEDQLREEEFNLRMQIIQTEDPCTEEEFLQFEFIQDMYNEVLVQLQKYNPEY